jgi:hypothetical protein
VLFRSPKIIKEVLRNIEHVNKEMQVLKAFTERKAEDTKIDLKQTMLELVNTFEQITKKGSLF